jgi:hypothetical protein
MLVYPRLNCHSIDIEEVVAALIDKSRELPIFATSSKYGPVDLLWTWRAKCGPVN